VSLSLQAPQRLILALLLVLNWVLVLAHAPSPRPRLTVPYSYFVSQVQSGNVTTVRRRARQFRERCGTQ
jgi:hypothetical protein